MTLAEYLNENKLTQRSFAAQVGVSPSYLNEIVQGVKSPRMALAAKIEALTNGAVPMAALVVTARAPTPSPSSPDAA